MWLYFNSIYFDTTMKMYKDKVTDILIKIISDCRHENHHKLGVYKYHNLCCCHPVSNFDHFKFVNTYCVGVVLGTRRSILPSLLSSLLMEFTQCVLGAFVQTWEHLVNVRKNIGIKQHFTMTMTYIFSGSGNETNLTVGNISLYRLLCYICYQ